MRELIEKIKRFITEHKKQIISMCVVVAVIGLVSLVTYLILLAAGVFVTGEDGVEFNAVLFDEYKNKWYGALLIIALQTVLTMLLCFIPGISMAFIMLINQLYGGNPLSAFGISFASVVISSSVLYILGRFGGYKLCVKLLGEEDTDKAMTLLRDNGTVYFPLMMMLPVFPDDALTMVAGTIKMKLAWFVPSIVIGRGIGVAAIIFGMAAFLPAVEKTYDWFILITILAFGLYCIFYIAGKLNKSMANKREGKHKPFRIRDLKSEDWFGIVCAALGAVVGGFLIASPRFLPKMSLYICFELFVVAIFCLLMIFFMAKSAHRAYKRFERHGRIGIRRVRPTLATMLPFIISVALLGTLTVVGLIIDFFPEMAVPYDWVVLIAAYLIWALAIYIITGKVRTKVKKMLLAKAKRSEESK